MKRILDQIHRRPGVYYLMVFLMLLVPSLLLYPAADAGSRGGMVTLLVLIVLANLFSIFI